MAITFISVGALGAGLNEVVPGLPAGWAEDDIFILHIEGEGEPDANADGQGDFGGALIGSVSSDDNGNAFDTRNTIYWKRATGSETAPTVDDAGNHTIACISAWRGCVATGNPIHKNQSSSEGGASGDRNSDVSADGVTTTIPEALIVIVVNNGDLTTISGWTNSNLVSITEAFDLESDAGSNGHISAAYGVLTAASASGATTATLDNNEMDANWVIALEPAAASGPVITDVDGDETWDDGDTGLVITGTGFV